MNYSDDMTFSTSLRKTKSSRIFIAITRIRVELKNENHFFFNFLFLFHKNCSHLKKILFEIAHITVKCGLDKCFSLYIFSWGAMRCDDQTKMLLVFRGKCNPWITCITYERLVMLFIKYFLKLILDMCGGFFYKCTMSFFTTRHFILGPYIFI